jgi:hypothetical protein
MSGFKNPNQRKFLFAQDKDKQKGINSTKSNPNSISTAWPSSQRTEPPAAYKLGNPSAPKFHPPVSASIKPTSNPNIIPPLPPLAKMPKFGRTRKYLKKGF